MIICRKAENFISKVSQDVVDICRPLLDRAAINYFDYNIVQDTGDYCMLTDTPAYIIDYFHHDQQLYPTLQELNSQLASSGGLAFLSDMINLPAGAAQHDKMKYATNIAFTKAHHINHRMYLILRGKGYYRICGFGLPADADSAIDFYLNHIDYLKRFVAYFECEAQHLIEQASWHQFQLSHYQDSAHHGNQSNYRPDKTKLKPRSIPLKIDGETVKLPYKEVRCVAHALKGYTAKETGKHFHLSQRTAEAYVRSVKEKLNVSSKADCGRRYFIAV